VPAAVSNLVGSGLLRLEHYLRVALDPLVELLVGLRRLLERHPVADDEARLGAAGDDQVAQEDVVLLHVGLAGTEPDPLLEHFPEGEEQLPLLGGLVDAARIGRHVEPWDTDPPGWVHHPDQVFEHLVRLLLASGPARDRLVADRVATTPDSHHASSTMS